MDTLLNLFTTLPVAQFPGLQAQTSGSVGDSPITLDDLDLESDSAALGLLPLFKEMLELQLETTSAAGPDVPLNNVPAIDASNIEEIANLLINYIDEIDLQTLTANTAGLIKQLQTILTTLQQQSPGNHNLDSGPELQHLAALHRLSARIQNLEVPEQRPPTPVLEAEIIASQPAAGGKDLPAGGKSLPAMLNELMHTYQRPASANEETAPIIDRLEKLIARLQQPGKDSTEPKPVMTTKSDWASDLNLNLRTQLQTINPVPGLIRAQVQPESIDRFSETTLLNHVVGVEKPAAKITSSIANGPQFNLILDTQVRSDDLLNQVSGRLRWMGEMKLPSVELQLHPVELGKLEIKIVTEDDQARVQFFTSTLAAKELIENSLPRLRELLGSNGLLLEQGDVTHRDLSKKGTQQEWLTSDSGTTAEPTATELVVLNRPVLSNHQIDHYV